MTLLYHDDFFQQHDTGRHPENAGRLKAVDQYLSEAGLLKKCARPKWKPATPEQLTAVHAPEVVELVKRFADAGGGQIESDTLVSPKSDAVARHAAGAACDAVDRVIAGESSSALCLVRPPGHHALPGEPMGFCLFNNIAVAAQHAINAHGLDRVLIVDWDVHHGNGTQAIFWEDPKVGFLSMHRFPFYPGSGRADETGSGAGLGTTANLPIQAGTPRKTQIDQLRQGVEKLADRIKPELILVSAGFDSHAKDPIGSLGLESEDFIEYTKIVQEVSMQHCDGRIVSLLEGGYNPSALSESVEAHLTQLMSPTTGMQTDKPTDATDK